jgi:hypothetical protein
VRLGPIVLLLYSVRSIRTLLVLLKRAPESCLCSLTDTVQSRSLFSSSTAGTVQCKRHSFALPSHSRPPLDIVAGYTAVSGYFIPVVATVRAVDVLIKPDILLLLCLAEYIATPIADSPLLT